jgi:F0F1-type ATP synthase assembly protein I
MGKNMVYAFAASQMGFMVVAGLLLGLWIDKKFDTMPVCGFIGLIAGFAGGIRFLILLVKEKDDGTQEDPKD